MERQLVVRRLICAANNVVEMIGTGNLFAACDGEEPQRSMVVQAFDDLEAATREATSMIKGSEPEKSVNPFVEYRQEILGQYSTAVRLASLVLHLYNGNEWTLDLASLLGCADERHTRIALEILAWYAGHTENDPHFMALAREILRRDHPDLYEDEET